MGGRGKKKQSKRRTAFGQATGAGGGPQAPEPQPQETAQQG